MGKKFKNLKRRIASMALAAAMGLSLAAGAVPLTATQAHAADPNENGHLYIQMLDSSVVGADSSVAGKTLSNTDVYNQSLVWGNLKTDHFLELPEGLARLESFRLVAYDVHDIWNTHVDAAGNSLNTGHYNAAEKYFSYENCLTKHGLTPINVKFTVRHDFTDGGSWIDIDGSDIDGKGTGFQAGHEYVFVLPEDMNEALYGYIPNSEAQAKHNGGTKGWQLQVRWAAGTAALQIGLAGSGAWSSVGIANGFLMGDKTQPMHNEVMRGGFSFDVEDVELSNGSQGFGNMDDAVFAVFNMNGTAQGPEAYSSESVNGVSKATWMAGSPTESQLRAGATSSTGYGYVTVDSNGNKKIDGTEAETFYPAYTYDEIMGAYEDYLNDSMTTAIGAGEHAIKGTNFDRPNNWTNGAYGHGKYAPAEIGSKKSTDNSNLSDGLFKMGETDTGMPVIPCMVIHSENGTVSTKSQNALPAGNYLVLQVKAGDGYYIDENFRPVVSIGPWYRNGGRTTSNGFGNAYPYKIWQSLEATLEGGSTVVIDKNVPVAYIGANVSGVKKLSDINPRSGGDFFVSNKGQSSDTITDTGYGDFSTHYSARTTSLPNGGTYIVNVTAGKGDMDDPLGTVAENSNKNGVGPRRNPGAGMSKFVAWQAPVRAGIAIYVGDSDDVAHADKGGAGYTAEPQGDGSFEGIRFRLYNDIGEDAVRKAFNEDGTFEAGGNRHQAKAGIEGNANNPSKVLAYAPGNENSYKEYAPVREQSGSYSLYLPADELPYGQYTITQVLTGEGYGNWNGHSDPDYISKVPEVVIAKFTVTRENEIVPTYKINEPAGSTKDETAEKYIINSAMYLPQVLVSGGHTIKVEAKDASANDVKVRIQAYNISDHYVYVDKGLADTGTADGTEVRRETRKLDYQMKVLPKGTLTVEQINGIVTNWTDALVLTKTLAASDGPDDMAKDLPYGTYLFAVTAVDGDMFTPIGGVYAVDSIDGPDDVISFVVRLADKSRTPEIKTTLIDSEYRLDSIPAKDREYITDVVDLSNLQADTDYVAYGILVDKKTGEVLPGTGVAAAKVDGYVSTGGGNANAGGANLDALILRGNTFATVESRRTDEYYAWLNSLNDYAGKAGNPTLPGLVKTAMNTSADNDATTYYTRIMGVLKYMGGYEGDDGLAGTDTVELNYGPYDTRKMEGATAVGYVFLCEGSEPSADILSCKNVGELMAATDATVQALHMNLGDEEQTARVPSLDISAEASYTGTKQIDPTETVKGTIYYGNVEPGIDYEIVATLRDNFGKEITGADNKRLEVTVPFKAKDAAGSVEAVFEGLDVQKYNGQRLTVYAELRRTVSIGSVTTPYWLIAKGDSDSMGWTVTDKEPGKNQVDVVAPTVITVLGDKGGNKEVDFDGRVTLIDKVTYKTLIPGEKYESVMTLVDKAGVQLMDDAGNPLTTSAEFTASAVEQTINLEITFDGKNVQGLEIVAFNDLYHISANHKALVAQEHAPDAEAQTIHATGEQFRKYFTTVVRDDLTNTHYAVASASTKLTDSVTIRNVDPATSYVLKTEIAYAANGTIVNQFEPVFTSVKSDDDGLIKADVPITMNTNPFQGQSLVVYQTLYNEKETEVVAEHRDNRDANQTFHVPSVDTVATGANGSSKVLVPNLVEHVDTQLKTVDGQPTTNEIKSYTYELTVADQIAYANLVPGNEYLITTEVVAQNGKGSVGTVTGTYVPATSTGIMTVYADLDVTNYLGQKLVVYETITDTYSNTVVASHKDLTDADQTVQIVSKSVADNPTQDVDDPETPKDDGEGGNDGKLDNTGKDIQTGVAERYGLYFALAAILAAVAGACGFAYWKKRRG